MREEVCFGGYLWPLLTFAIPNKSRGWVLRLVQRAAWLKQHKAEAEMRWGTPQGFSVRETEDGVNSGEKGRETQLSPSTTEQILWGRARGNG